MEVYIKGMEMPTNCFYCPLSVLSGERLFCEVTKDEVVRAKRPSDCPLVPVPPHGDLIDRNELIENCMKEDSFLAELLFRKVSNAPTIIEAEEGE